MSDDNSVEIKHMNQSIEKMSSAVSSLANSVNELVVQEKVRAERDAHMEKRVTKIEEKLDENQPGIDWAVRAKKFWDSQLTKWGIPIFCFGLLVVAAKAIGIPVFGGA